MIFYFSGTGNSKWVAHKVAEQTNDVAMDIIGLCHPVNIELEKQIGFVFPVYAWGAPQVMIDFAKKLPNTQAFVFGICTCGEEAGKTMKHFSQIYPLNSSYSLIMPNNYIIGADVDSKQQVEYKLEIATKQIEKISFEIRQKKNGYCVQEGSGSALKSGVVCWGFNRFARTTKPFFVLESCNGCGLCAKRCPACTIQMENKKPIWGKQCYQCLACINRCPKQAIQYGKSTKDKGRYFIEQYIK